MAWVGVFLERRENPKEMVRPESLCTIVWQRTIHCREVTRQRKGGQAFRGSRQLESKCMGGANEQESRVFYWDLLSSGSASGLMRVCGYLLLSFLVWERGGERSTQRRICVLHWGKWGKSRELFWGHCLSVVFSHRSPYAKVAHFGVASSDPLQ